MASTIYRRGSTSANEVKKLQTSLKNQGLYKGAIDGIWGNQTSNALSQYKKNTGGSNTAGNSFGNETINKLYSTSTKTTTPKGNVAKTGAKYTDSLDYAKNNYGSFSNEYAAALKAGKPKEDPYLVAQRDNALSDAYNLYSSQAGQLGDVYNQGVSKANASADDMARQYYITYKQGKNNLSEQLSSNGITGGASETALNSILNGYSSNLASNEASRQSALSELGNNYQSELASLANQLQEQRAGINQSYGQAIANDLSERQDLYNQALAEANSQYRTYIWNQKVQANIDAKNPKYVWTDDTGRLHYNNNESVARAAKAAGYKVKERTKTKKSSSSESSKKKVGKDTYSDPFNEYSIDTEVWKGKSAGYNTLLTTASAMRQNKNGRTKAIDYLQTMADSGKAKKSDVKQVLKVLNLT